MYIEGTLIIKSHNIALTYPHQWAFQKQCMHYITGLWSTPGDPLPHPLFFSKKRWVERQRFTSSCRLMTWRSLCIDLWWVGDFTVWDVDTKPLRDFWKNGTRIRHETLPQNPTSPSSSIVSIIYLSDNMDEW